MISDKFCDCRIEVANVSACPPNAPLDASAYCYPAQIETLSDYNYITPVLLAFYMLFGNVILLNLLIAIFS